MYHGKKAFEHRDRAKQVSQLQKNIINTSNWLQTKQLLGMPWRVAIALQNDGWILRNDIIWHKPNPMPSSVKDRLNTTYEHVFHFVKFRKYFYDLDAIREAHKTESLDRAEYGFNVIPRAWKEGAIPVSGGKQCNIDCHPAGKNPGDVVKHDIAVGRIGDFSYNDPLHTKGYYPSGKNPGDIIEENMKMETKKRGYSDHSASRTLTHLHQMGKDYSKSELGKNPGDFWSLTTQPFTGYNPDLEHFAVFPESLVLKPLKSSCPKDICKKCGQPRIRLTKTSYKKRWNRSQKEKHGNDGKKIDGYIHPNYGDFEGLKQVETIGWSDCGCNAGFGPGIVLDPFGGRGTVGKVAKQLGLHYILFDIKPEYCELARLYIAGQKNKIHKDQEKLM